MLSYFSFTEINLGALTLQVWGVFVALGFVAALAISLKEARKARLADETVWDVMIISLAGMIVGGRIFYFLSSPEKSVAVLTGVHGGFSLAGGVALTGVLSLLYLKNKKRDFKKVFDILTPGFVVALIFVRLGCFLIGDHIGKITTLPWGMEFADGTLRHPVASYEILFLIFLSGVIYELKSKRKRDGHIFLAFIASYAIFRFGADFLRCDDLSFCDARFYGLTLTQWVLLCGIPLFIFHKILSNKPSAE